MAKYRKKPVVIDAIQFTGMNQQDIRNFTGYAAVAHCGYLTIDTLEGQMVANKGDWIIKGVMGEFYPCKPDIFEATYEPA
jgi:hypothetical protein